jgi:DNA polymerase-3 subunit alpha
MSDFKNLIYPKRFTGLHAHCGTGSPYDGLGYPNQHIDFVLSNEMDSWALTDHGNGNGLAHAHTYAKKLKKQGQKYRQVYGVEFYFVPSLGEWRISYENHREEVRLARSEKKAKEKTDINSEDEISGGLIIENEDETKSTYDIDKNDWKRRYHLVVLAKSNAGLQNLFTLVKKSYTDGFYRFPRIDFDLLKQHGEGLIVSTACIGGYPASLIARGEATGKHDSEILNDLENMSDRFIDAVGRDNFNLEIQFNSLSMQHKTNNHLIKLHEKTGIPLVATADSHYYSRDMWEARELYRKLGRMGARGDSMPSLPAFEDLKCELYPKNATQMWEEYKKHVPDYSFYEGKDQIICDAIERTYDIAWDQCNEVWFNEEAKLPTFDQPGNPAFNQLVSRVKKALVEEGLHLNKEYVDRTKMELEDIKYLGFENYFLTMTKVFDLASKSTIIGPGRGSGAGSLVNYLLGITTTDPIKYGLLWERFLHRAKAGWPDIDTDAGDRDVLINAARSLFGEEAVVPVSNFNTLKLKSLIKDVSKFYGIDFGEVNAMTNTLEKDVMHKAMGDHEERSTYVLTHEDCMKYSQKYADFMEEYPKVCEQVQNLFMESRSIGRHAGGVLICPDLEKYMPVIKVRGELQTPWSEGMNFRHLETHGFLKFDFLGLTTLKMVEDCIRLILRKQGNQSPTFADIQKFFDDKLNCRYNILDDQSVWEHVYHKGRFVQVFQFTQQGARSFCMTAKPRTIEELATITAIYRPGPLAAGVHRKYVKAKKSVESGTPIQYDHPVIKDILSETYGFISFQEQFMLLAQKLANFDKGASDKMRKTLVKKSLDSNAGKVQERVNLRKKFVTGAVEFSGMDEGKAEKLYETIEYFSGYGFNKSHAVSYAIDSYYSAWLHTYYEKEWLATCLQTQNGSNKFGKVIGEIKSLGYTILPPDINASSDVWVYSEEREGFVPPLTAIKGVGDAAVSEIMINRPYRNLDDVLFNEDNSWKPSKMNKTCFDSLCKVEAFSSLEEFHTGEAANHHQLHESIVGNYDLLKKGRYGMTKTAYKKATRERGNIPPYIGEKLVENSDILDWSRSEKIAFCVELMASADEDLVFPPVIMSKIQKAKVPAVTSLNGDAKGIVWFCIQEIYKKQTKNGKDYYRMKVCDNNSESCWLRVWGSFGEEPTLYTIWMAEVSSSESWGCSSSTYKMKKLDVD